MESSQRIISTPEIALIAITRTALGVGIGLLLARRLNDQARLVGGLAMLTVGVATTVPLVIEVFGGRGVKGISCTPMGCPSSPQGNSAP